MACWAGVGRLTPGAAPPAQSEFNRRVRWLWGAFEGLRQRVAAAVPEDPWQQIDTTVLPVKHPSRGRGPDAWDGPGACGPASGSTRRTESGSTASGWGCALT